MKAYQRRNSAPSSDTATLNYLNYILEAVRICQIEGRQRSTLADSLATQRLLGDPSTTISHSAHLNLYLRACDSLAIPPFPITTNKLILRLLAILPGARARQIVQALPPSYQRASLGVPENAPLGYVEAFEFIHKRTNQGLPGWPQGSEISRAEWSSFTAEIRWISEGSPAAPSFAYGISLELASALPRLRALAGDPALQKNAYSLAQAWLAQQSHLAHHAGVLARHRDFLKPLDVPTFPITFEKLSLDLVRRVNLPAAVELYNTTRRQTDDLFRGFWSQKDVDEALDVLCSIGNVTRCLWPGASLLTKHHPHLVAIRLAAPIIDATTTRRESNPSLTVTLRQPSALVQSAPTQRRASAGQPRSEAQTRLANLPTRPHSSHSMRADPTLPASATPAPVPPARPRSAHTIRSGLSSPTPAPTSSSSSVPPSSTAPLSTPAPPPPEQDFAAAYAALFAQDDDDDEEPSSPLEIIELEPATRSVVVLPSPHTSPPLRRVVSLPVQPTTVSPTRVFPPTAALLADTTSSTISPSLRNTSTVPPPSRIPLKRPSLSSSAEPTILVKKQRTPAKPKPGAQAAVLEFCRDFAAVFGSSGEVEKGKECQSLEEAVGELRGVMEGIEWIKGR